MSNTPVSRLLLGSGANGIGLIARMAEQLLMVPILLTAWSVPLYGEWLLISAIPVYLSLSDMGFVSAGSNELTRRSQKGVTEGVRSFYNDYVSTFASWSSSLLLFFTALVFFTPLDTWLGLEILARQEAQIVFAFLIANVLLSKNALPIHAGLRACRKAHVGFFLRAMSSITRIFLCALLVLSFDVGPIGVAVTTAAVRLVEICVMAIVSHRNGLTPRWRLFRKSTTKMLPYLTIGLEFMLLPLSEAILLQGMVIMVGTTLGVVLVAVFSTHRTLTRMALQVVQMGIAPLQAEVGLLQGEADRPILIRLVKRVGRITFWLSVLIGIALAALGHWIFATWTRGEIAFMPILFFPLLLSTVLEGIWRVPASVRFGTNKHRPLVWSYLTLSLVGIFVAYILAQNWGLEGVGYALVFIDGTMCVITLYFNRLLLGVGITTYLRSLLVPPVDDIRYVAEMLKNRRTK